MSFVFSDDSGRKVRPVLVVSSEGYNRARKDVIVAAITSNVRRRFGDYMIDGWTAAGLLFPSSVTAVLRTVKRAAIVRRLGHMRDLEMDNVGRALRRSLDL